MTVGGKHVTVTVKEQLDDPPVLFAEAVTVVVPTGNSNGELMRVLPIVYTGVSVPLHGSLALAAKATDAVVLPGSVKTEILPGQMTVGGTQCTKTKKLQLAVCPCESVTVAVTFVSPTGKT